MCLKLRSSLGVVLGLLGLLSPLVFAAEQASKPFPAAQLVAVEGAAHTYWVTDRGGRVLTTTVPAQSITDIRTNSPDGLVRATIIAIDMATNQVKAKTDAGQVLVLAVPHEALAGLQLGNTFTLAMPQHAAVAAHR
jgi:hypothetical protein